MILSFQRGTEIKNHSIISTPKYDDRHKNKKIIKKHTSVYNQYILHSVQNLKILSITINIDVKNK
jgi:hypothetical protein